MVEMLRLRGIAILAKKCRQDRHRMCSTVSYLMYWALLEQHDDRVEYKRVKNRIGILIDNFDTLEYTIFIVSGQFAAEAS